MLNYLDTKTAINTFICNEHLGTKKLLIYQNRKVSFKLLKMKNTLLKGYKELNKLYVRNKDSYL